MRGPLAPGDLPVSRTRAEQFDELVLSAVARLESRWATELADVEVLVEEVPTADDRDVPLGRTEPATPHDPARIVVYRRPVEARARGLRARELLVHDVVVEQLAELLGLDPGTVDPDD
jgi:predicted Zn-dependent protease with MMP-like domain